MSIGYVGRCMYAIANSKCLKKHDRLSSTKLMLVYSPPVRSLLGMSCLAVDGRSYPERVSFPEVTPHHTTKGNKHRAPGRREVAKGKEMGMTGMAGGKRSVRPSPTVAVGGPPRTALSRSLLSERPSLSFPFSPSGLPTPPIPPSPTPVKKQRPLLAHSRRYTNRK